MAEKKRPNTFHDALKYDTPNNMVEEPALADYKVSQDVVVLADHKNIPRGTNIPIMPTMDGRDENKENNNNKKNACLQKYRQGVQLMRCVTPSHNPPLPTLRCRLAVLCTVVHSVAGLNTNTRISSYDELR